MDKRRAKIIAYLFAAKHLGAELAEGLLIENAIQLGYTEKDAQRIADAIAEIAASLRKRGDKMLKSGRKT